MRTLSASLVTAFTPKPVMPKWWRTDFQVCGQSSFTGGISLTSATSQVLIEAPLVRRVARIVGTPSLPVNDGPAPQAAAADALGDRARLVARVGRRDRVRRGAAADPGRPPFQPRRRAVGLPRLLAGTRGALSSCRR